jgi:hypothetical protein
MKATMIPELSAGEFEVYFRLAWLFVIIMFFSIAILYCLYRAMRRGGALCKGENHDRMHGNQRV